MTTLAGIRLSLICLLHWIIHCHGNTVAFWSSWLIFHIAAIHLRHDRKTGLLVEKFINFLLCSLFLIFSIFSAFISPHISAHCFSRPVPLRLDEHLDAVIYEVEGADSWCPKKKKKVFNKVRLRYVKEDSGTFSTEINHVIKRQDVAR